MTSAADPGRTGTTEQEHLRQESFGRLIGELASDTSTLVKQEIALARAELSEKARRAGAGVGMLVGAAVVALLMLGALTAFLVLLLDIWMDGWLAALVVTVLWAVVAAALALVGRSRLQQALPPTPEQTVETVKEDVQWAKTQVRSGRT